MAANAARFADVPALTALAGYAAGIDVARLPPDVVARAKTCIVDALAGCFALPRDRRVLAALAVSAPRETPPAATVVGRAARTAPADAAFANAVASAAAETNDTFPATAVHPGIVVVPAVLAAAEAAGREGADAIAGVVAGYEAMARIARAVITPEVVKIWRSSGLTGPAAAAIGAARAAGLDAAAIADAAALGTHAAGGFNEWANAGTAEHVFHIGAAARTGVVSATLAEAGAGGAHSVLDGRAGLLAAFGASARAAGLAAGLGDGHEIRGVVHKPAPACFFAQTPAQVAATLAASIDRAEIASVAIGVGGPAARFPGCDNPGPMRSRQDASMSIHFAVASVLLRGAIRHANWEAFDDPATNALAARCSVVIDPDLDAAAPAKAGARIAIRLRDGSVREARAADLRSMTDAEVEARFLDLAGAVLGPARAASALAHVRRLEEPGGLAALLAALRPLEASP